jgi:hypothetical protein
MYVRCNDLYAHCTPAESMVRGSAAQTDGVKLRVRAPPGFRSSAFP